MRSSLHRTFPWLLLLCLGLQTGCPDPRRSDDDDVASDDDDSTDSLDSDGDGVPDAEDACPDDATGWTDEDGDEHCDEADDDCLNDPTGWTDADGDNHCDEADDDCPDDPLQWTDADGDGYCDEDDDDCPDDPNGWADTDGDGDCDGDDDSDGDGIPDGEEQIYGEDCAISDRDLADTDGDGQDDNEDFYPRDPYPEYVLFRNDVGTIDLVLSNRDGTFQAPEEIGDPFGNTGNDAYRYTAFVISDFDNNGRTDFLAIGDPDPSPPATGLDLWWFGRVSGPSSFAQRLVASGLDSSILWGVADLDNDEDVDLMRLHRTDSASGNIATAVLTSYLNEGTLETANCAWTEDATNPDGCAFVAVEGSNLTSWAAGDWIVRTSRDAVDVDGDGNRDVVAYTHTSGGDSTIPVMLLQGNGDGTFTMGAHDLFTHNANGTGSGQSPVNSVVFADFDNDELGDTIVGLDDDGDAGSAWFYPGSYSSTEGYFVDTAAAVETFDLNTAAESGGENWGVTTSARAFDFDFDGNQDLMLGYNYEEPWAAPSETVYMAGLGNGYFAPPTVIRDFPSSTYGQSFALPQRLCQRFPIGD